MPGGGVNYLYRKLSEAGAVAYLTITGTPIDAGQDRLPARRRISRGEEYNGSVFKTKI